MRTPEPPLSFVEFVTARSHALLRSAWLLTGDAGRAEDLLQTALAKAWRHWRTVERAGSPEAYVRRILFTTHATWWRRGWRSEFPVGELPDVSGGTDVASDAATRDAVRHALAQLSYQTRAIVILRYIEDRPVAEVATVLGCSQGMVKTQARRALAALRNSPDLRSITYQGADA